MERVILARQAMATRFEMVLYGPSATSLRAAGEEAFAEIERLERQLSFYQQSSEISRINALASTRPVKVEPLLFRLLLRASKLYRFTEGAFDPTIGPLMRCWGLVSTDPQRPAPTALEAARAITGMDLVLFDPEHSTIRFSRPGVLLDLGGIGKGYALDCGATLLQEAGVTAALLHGGTSSVVAIGHPPDLPAWNIGIPEPETVRAHPLEARQVNRDQFLATIPLIDCALSISGVHGKFFQQDGRTFGHVLDPRTGQPVQNAWLAGALLPSATDTDALSTALLVLGENALPRLAARIPGFGGLVLASDGLDKPRLHSHGLPFSS